ncbi:hypothetical protein [Oceanobacillus senegalensis]|uniref:hypothetical protein n=1 Tax=Oceanobacillus senegalensis TaxID=1936063 RepID=UPI001C500E0C|nr:hypothetical protein [Oceanobacillus senegalensis]
MINVEYPLLPLKTSKSRRKAIGEVVIEALKKHKGERELEPEILMISRKLSA